MPGKGFHLGPRLTDQQRQDIEFGFQIAKEISRLEIGQTVVVKEEVSQWKHLREPIIVCSEGGPWEAAKEERWLLKLHGKNTISGLTFRV